MRSKTAFPLLVIISLLFISVGDRILPQPLSNLSKSTRTSINRFLLSIFPDKEFKDPHKRTEDAIKKEEQGK